MRRGRRQTQQLRRSIEAKHEMAVKIAVMRGQDLPSKPVIQHWEAGQVIKIGNKEYSVQPNGSWKRVA
jgi:hypothetical protein